MMSDLLLEENDDDCCLCSGNNNIVHGPTKFWTHAFMFVDELYNNTSLYCLLKYKDNCMQNW